MRHKNHQSVRPRTLQELKSLCEKLDLTPLELQYYLALEKIYRKQLYKKGGTKISDNS